VSTTVAAAAAAAVTAGPKLQTRTFWAATATVPVTTIITINHHHPSPTTTNHHQPPPTTTNHHQPPPTTNHHHQVGDGLFP